MVDGALAGGELYFFSDDLMLFQINKISFFEQKNLKVANTSCGMYYMRSNL